MMALCPVCIPAFHIERPSLPMFLIVVTCWPCSYNCKKDCLCHLQSFPPLDPEDVVYEPRSSRLLVRGLGENDMDEDEEDCESSARLLGMSFMSRSSAHRSTSSPYTRQSLPR